MPILSDISGAGNFTINLMKLLIEKPYLAVIFIILILFFPLNVLDFLLYIFVNLFIVIANVLLWIIIILPNILFSAINIILFKILDDALWEIIPGDQPTITIPLIEFYVLDYIDIDYFEWDDTLIGVLMDSLSLSFPIWKININMIIKMVKIKIIKMVKIII